MHLGSTKNNSLSCSSVNKSTCLLFSLRDYSIVTFEFKFLNRHSKSNCQTDNTAFVLHQNKEFQLSSIVKLEFVVFYMVSETFKPARKERKATSAVEL